MERRFLDSLPIATVAIRDERIVYLNAALEKLLRAPRGEIAGRPFIAFIDPEDREQVRLRHLARLRGEPVPSTYDARLLVRGERRPVRLHVSTLETEVVVQLQDLGLEVVHWDRLTALARIGAAVQREQSDAEIHRRIRAELPALGLSALLQVPEGDGVRVSLFTGEMARVRAWNDAAGGAVEGMRRPWTPFQREGWEQGAAYTEDGTPDAARFLGTERGVVFPPTPMPAAAVRIETGGIPAALLVLSGPWLRHEDLPALRLFGAQISAALDAARAIQTLSDRNAEQAALVRLAAASGAVQDLEAFLETAGRLVRETVGCRDLAVYLVAADGRTIDLAYATGPAPGASQATRRGNVGGPFLGKVVREGRSIVLLAEELPEPAAGVMLRDGVATLAAVPLRFRSAAIGLLVTAWADRRDAAACRLPLVEAMGSHFAAAVYTHRLVGDLRTRVSELTLLNDLAHASADLDPVRLLQSSLQRVADTFRSQAGSAYLVRGDALYPVVRFGMSEEAHRITTRIPLGEPSAGLAAAERRPVRVPGDVPDNERTRHFREKEGMQHTVAIPLLVKDRALGVFVLGRRHAEPFSDGEVSLLSALGAQLGVAVENAELHLQAQRRVEELGLLLEVGRSLVATLDLGQVLDAGVRNLARIVEAPDAYLLLADEAGEHLVIRAVTGSRSELLGKALPLRPPGGFLVSQVFEKREAVRVEDAALDPRTRTEMLAATGAKGWLGLPLVVRDRTIGVAVIVDTRTPRLFTPEEVERGMAIGNQLAVAAVNAQLYDDLRRSYAELARTQAQLVRQERLAALGELAAVVAHEVRNPLGVIFNSLGALRRMVRPEGDARMLFEIVGEEADRLNRIVGDLLDFARPSKPSIRPEPVERLLDEVLSKAMAQAPQALEVVRDVEGELPPVSADARQLRQALLNVVLNAVQAMPEGGRLTVRARRDGGAVRIEICDTGPGIPPELRERVFEPFFTTRATGTGLGLAVVRRVAQDHRGTVSIEEAPGGGAAFVLRLPLDAGPAPVADGPELG